MSLEAITADWDELSKEYGKLEVGEIKIDSVYRNYRSFFLDRQLLHLSLLNL